MIILVIPLVEFLNQLGSKFSISGLKTADNAKGAIPPQDTGSCKVTGESRIIN